MLVEHMTLTLTLVLTLLKLMDIVLMHEHMQPCACSGTDSAAHVQSPLPHIHTNILPS